MDKLYDLYNMLNNQTFRLENSPVVIWQHLKLFNGFEKVLETTKKIIHQKELAEFAKLPIDYAFPLEKLPLKSYEGEETPTEVNTKKVTFYPVNGDFMITPSELRIHVYYEEK